MRNLMVGLILVLSLPALSSAIAKNQQNLPTAPQKGTERYEQWLQNEVRHQLMLLPWYTILTIWNTASTVIQLR
jgi:hypothetical protein